MRNHRTKHLLVSDWKLAFACLLYVCHHVLKLCQPNVFVAWVYPSFDAVFDTDERYDAKMPGHCLAGKHKQFHRLIAWTIPLSN